MKRPHPEMMLREMVKYHVRVRQCAGDRFCKAVSSLVAFVGHEVTLAEVSEKLVTHWASKILPVLAPSTAKLYVSSIRTLWRHAAEWNATPKPPFNRVGVPDFRKPISPRVRHVDDSMAVWTLFELLYQPEKLTGKSAKAHSVYRAAIKWLCFSLGRDARLSDLTHETFTTFYEFCADRGLAPATIENHRQRLTTLLWFAFDKGIIAERPLVPPVDPRQNGKPAPWNEVGTLAYFYANTFKPEALSHMRAQTVAYFDAAVRAYLRFAGGNVAPEVISQDSIKAFAKWLREAGGYSAFVIGSYPSIVTRIWRQHSPEKAPPLPASNRNCPPGKDGSLLQFYERDYLGEHPLGSRTNDKYRSHLRRFNEFLGRDAMLSDLTAQLLNAHFVKRLETKSPRTVRDERMTLLALWKSAFDWGRVDELPRRVRKIKALPLTPDAFTPAELARLVSATDEPDFDNRCRGVHVGKLLKALLLASYDTGLRRSDLLSLKRENLRDDGIIVLTMAKTSHVHTCRVRPETIAAFDAAAVKGDDRLLPWNVGVGHLHRRWRLLLIAADIPVHRRNGLQKLRRTSATALERAAPGSASHHLGHRSANMARAHYLDPSQCANPMMPPAIPVDVS
jgi:integrase